MGNLSKRHFSKMTWLLLFHCQSLKEDMGKKRQMLEQLNEMTQDLAQLLNNKKALKKIDSNLEELAQRWDNLVQKLEDYSNQVPSKYHLLFVFRMGFIWI